MTRYVCTNCGRDLYEEPGNMATCTCGHSFLCVARCPACGNIFNPKTEDCATSLRRQLRETTEPKAEGLDANQESRR